MPVKHACEAPGLLLEGLHIHDLYEEQIAGLGTFDLKRARQVVHPREIDVADIVSRVVIPDLAARPTIRRSEG